MHLAFLGPIFWFVDIAMSHFDTLTVFYISKTLGFGIRKENQRGGCLFLDHFVSFQQSYCEVFVA